MHDGGSQRNLVNGFACRRFVSVRRSYRFPDCNESVSVLNVSCMTGTQICNSDVVFCPLKSYEIGE